MYFREDLVTRRAFDVSGDEWWKRAVVYQIYPRSFQDSDGDGIGDLRGIRKRLDHLEGLGVDVLWLSPIYPSPQVDNGYDIRDYYDIDPVFGSLDDFDLLLEDVHARGMKLIMDLVVNHTSDEHPWFQESRSSAASAKRDWYIWRPARAGHEPGTPGAEPNNWGSVFSGSAWTFDEVSGEYYLHLFHSKQPDLNWENPEVRRAVHTMMSWWLDRGIDGFRMDVINLISKPHGLPDGKRREGEPFGDGFNLCARGPRLHEFLREMKREVFDCRTDDDQRAGELLAVGETPGITRGEVTLFTDPRRGELDMVFQFEHVDLGLEHGKFEPRPLESGELADCLDAWQDAQSETGWNSLYLSNHDQPRVVSRFGDESMPTQSATALATVIHLLRGTPFVFQGEELGLANPRFETIEDFRDVESLRYYESARLRGWDEDETIKGLRQMGRDNARTPIPWDDRELNSGFTTGHPWIEVSSNASTVCATRQVEDPNSVFSYFAALISMRHHVPAVATGTYERLRTGDRAVYAFRRCTATEELLVTVNLSSRSASPDFVDEPGEGFEHVLGNLDERREVNDPLAPWEARVHWKNLALNE